MLRDNWKKYRSKTWKNVNYGTIMFYVCRQHDSRGSNTLFITTHEFWALPCAICNVKIVERTTFVCDVFKCFGENSNKQIIGKRYASLFAPFVISHRISCEHQSGTSTIIQMSTATASVLDSNFNTHTHTHHCYCTSSQQTRTYVNKFVRLGHSRTLPSSLVYNLY